MKNLESLTNTKIALMLVMASSSVSAMNWTPTNVGSLDAFGQGTDKVVQATVDQVANAFIKKEKKEAEETKQYSEDTDKNVSQGVAGEQTEAEGQRMRTPATHKKEAEQARQAEQSKKKAKLARLKEFAATKLTDEDRKAAQEEAAQWRQKKQDEKKKKAEDLRKLFAKPVGKDIMRVVANARKERVAALTDAYANSRQNLQIGYQLQQVKAFDENVIMNAEQQQEGSLMGASTGGKSHSKTTQAPTTKTKPVGLSNQEETINAATKKKDDRKVNEDDSDVTHKNFSDTGVQEGQSNNSSEGTGNSANDEGISTQKFAQALPTSFQASDNANHLNPTSIPISDPFQNNNESPTRGLNPNLSEKPTTLQFDNEVSSEQKKKARVLENMITFLNGTKQASMVKYLSLEDSVQNGDNDTFDTVKTRVEGVLAEKERALNDLLQSAKEKKVTGGIQDPDVANSLYEAAKKMLDDSRGDVVKRADHSTDAGRNETLENIVKKLEEQVELVEEFKKKFERLATF